MDDDKARRNLVMVSAAILLAAWLDLPLAGIAERVLGIKEADKIDPARAWSALCAVLLYLAYRFTFSDDEQKARDALHTDWQAQRNKWQQRVLWRELQQAAAGRKPLSTFAAAAAEYFNREREESQLGLQGGGALTVLPSKFAVQHDLPWQGKVTVGWHAVRPNGSEVQSTGVTLPYSFDGFRRRLLVVLPAALVVVLRSKTSSVAVVPTILGLLAMGCAAHQLGTALMR